jgi:hypothetical protein
MYRRDETQGPDRGNGTRDRGSEGTTMSRHQARRRRLYGRRLHEVRERRDRHPGDAILGETCAFEPEPVTSLAPVRARVSIPIVADAHAIRSIGGVATVALGLD